MSNATIRQALEWEAETNANGILGENTSTFTNRAPIIAPVDVTGLKHPKLPPMRVTQYLQEDTEWILGPQTGTFKTRFWLAGHGSTMSGSPTVTTIEQLIAYAFSNPTSTGTLSATSSTTATGGGTATAITTAASATFAPGGLFRCGSLNDARGGGMMYPVATHVTTTLTPLIALPAAPANLDVIYPVRDYFFPEDPSGTTPIAVQGVRFRLRTANLAYEMHGCFATDVELGDFNTGKPPWIEITWTTSWWKYTATSGISSVANTAFNPAPIAAGSFAINDVGTATRATRSIRDFKIAIKLGRIIQEGPGGNSAYQTIIGARICDSTIDVSWLEDADAATATPVLDGYFTAGTPKHLMYTLSTADGSAIGIYFPNLRIVGDRPVQVANGNANRFPIAARATTGPTNTSERTLSAMRVGVA